MKHSQVPIFLHNSKAHERDNLTKVQLIQDAGFKSSLRNTTTFIQLKELVFPVTHTHRGYRFKKTTYINLVYIKVKFQTEIGTTCLKTDSMTADTRTREITIKTFRIPLYGNYLLKNKYYNVCFPLFQSHLIKQNYYLNPHTRLRTHPSRPTCSTTPPKVITAERTVLFEHHRAYHHPHHMPPAELAASSLTLPLC